MNETNTGIHENWHGKPYYSLDAYCKNTYGEKLYKLALNAGLSCPNRDGTLDTRGCIFCSVGGSGDFAAPISSVRHPGAAPDTPHSGAALDTACSEPNAHSALEASFRKAYEQGLSLLQKKETGQKFIAYFQAYTNTYGPVAYLEKIYSLALAEPTVAGISIATRPDCINEEIVALLVKLKAAYAPKFIWIELGLQTIHERTAAFIRRGYPLSCFEESIKLLHAADIPVITHVILGLPGETKKDMLETISYLNTKPIWGIKLQLLHILKGTDLGQLYMESPESYCQLDSLEIYLDVLIDCITQLRPDMVIHRLTGDAPHSLLLAPLFSKDKRRVLNTLHRKLKEQNTFQGKYYEERKISCTTP